MKVFHSFSIRSRLMFAFGGLQCMITLISAYAAFAIWESGGDSSSLFILIGLAVVSIIAGGFAMLSMIKSIVKPIQFLTEVAAGVGNGDLNIHLQTDARDEIGVFTNSFGKMINTINDLTEDIEFMAVAQSEGVSHIHIDSQKYNGKYNEISVLVNDMISEQSQMTHTAVDTIYEIATGNFHASVQSFPGDKVFLNHTIEALRKNLSAVHHEISRLTQSAIRGDLANSADVSTFTGDWSGLMADINRLLAAFVAPINETTVVLEKIAAGDFTARMKGDYKGDYKKIEESVNQMALQIGAYIKEITHVLSAVSAKDFTVEIEREYVGDFDLVKGSINKILADLNAIFMNIRAVSDQLNIGSKVVSDSSMTLASGMQDQTSAIDHLMDALTDFEQVSVVSAGEAENAASISHSANEHTMIAVEEMDRLLLAMDEIKKASAEIAGIIKNTDDIAYQINLLSINASIEAASAGEHGKGFAVVAREVRNLANRSRSIADEAAVSIMASSEKIVAGSDIVKSATEMLQNISGQISSSSDIITGISDISKKQVDKMNQVHENTLQISSMTNKTFDTPHQFAATAEELSSQAEVLNETLGRFKLRSVAAEA